MRSSYVKIYRTSLQSWVFEDAEIWRLWTWCLMRATFRDRDVTVKTGRGTKIVSLKAGQFIYGRISAATILGWTASSTKRRMDKLQKHGSLKIEKPDSHFSVVTITNWRGYQSKSKAKRTGKNQKSGQANGQPSGQATGQATEHKQECLEECLEECTTGCAEKTTDLDTKPLDAEHEILIAWNSTPGVRKAVKLTTTRCKAIRTRLAESSWRESWRESLAKFPLRCFSGIDPWIPDIDWWLKVDIVTRIIEGKYDWTKPDGRTNTSDSPARVREREYNEADIESRTLRST